MLQVSLARGHLNHRRTARQLIAEHGWGASEEAVNSALRRCQELPWCVDLDEALDLLQGASVEVTMGRSLAWVRLVDAGRAGIDAFLHETELSWADVVLSAGGGRATVLVPEAQVLDLTVEVGRENVEAVHERVACLRVLHQAAEAGAALACSVVTAALGFEGIGVLEAVCGPDGCKVVVDSGDALRADRVLRGLAFAQGR